MREIKALLTLAHAQASLGYADPAVRLAAVKALAETLRRRSRACCCPLTDKATESDDKVRYEAIAAIKAIDSRLAMAENLGRVFSGLSLGSILLLAALGLAITYGVMGVINMAHGELLMVGAYSAYAMQSLFRAYFPEYIDWYLPAAMPGRLLRRGAGRRADGAHGDPLALRPSAGNAARHLGHLAGPDPVGARHLRCAERRSGQPELDVRRHRAACRT